MKRCPNCNFPNIDSDRICFKCGAALLEEIPAAEALSNQTDTTTQTKEAIHTDPSFQDIQTVYIEPPSPYNPTLHISSSDEPKIKRNTDDLVAKPNPVFDANANISAFIHKPTDTTEADSKTTTTKSKPLPSSPVASTTHTATSEVAATSMPQPTIPAPPLVTSSPSLPTPARILPKYKSLACLKTLSILMGLLFGLALIATGVLLIFVYPGLLGVASCIGFVGMGLISIFLGFVLSAVLGWLNDVECNQRKQIELINHIYHKIED